MWTSISKNSIPSPVRRDVANAIKVGSFVRISSFIPELKGMTIEKSSKVMSLDEAQIKPHEELARLLAPELEDVNQVIRDRMSSRNAPRIPEVTAHLIEAGGKPTTANAYALCCGALRLRRR